MLKSEIFTEAFKDFSDCEDYRRSLVDRDFGWEPGVALQALTGFLSSPDRRGGWQLYLSLWAESPPSSY